MVEIKINIHQVRKYRNALQYISLTAITFCHISQSHVSPKLF